MYRLLNDNEQIQQGDQFFSDGTWIDSGCYGLWKKNMVPYRRKMPDNTRLVDIDGYTINNPEYYHESLKWGNLMIEKMEADKIDRSDMMVIVMRLYQEMLFSIVMCRDRSR